MFNGVEALQPAGPVPVTTMKPGVWVADTVIAPAASIEVAGSTVVGVPGKVAAVAPAASDHATCAFDGCCEAVTGVGPHEGT